MKKKITVFLIGLFIMGISSASIALNFGPSNLGVFGYPKATCLKPFKPYKFYNQSDIDWYNFQVREYNDCINLYLKGCANDIDEIIGASREAVR